MREGEILADDAPDALRRTRRTRHHRSHLLHLVDEATATAGTRKETVR